MDERTISALIDNEREWRRHMITKVEVLVEEVSKLKSRSLVVEIIGGSLFLVLLALIQIK